MTTDTFDHYRTTYPDLDLAGHRTFYQQVAADYPDQNYYDQASVKGFIDWAQPSRVTELGGWDGALAAHILQTNATIRSWTNYEVATPTAMCATPRYRRVTDRWIWDTPPTQGAFIASHSLEHLSERHLDLLLDWLHCDSAYIDVPLRAERIDWQGSTTTHILPLSIAEFDQRWADAGWAVEHEAERGGTVPSYVRWLSRVDG